MRTKPTKSYWKAYRGLYGNDKLNLVPEEGVKKKSSPRARIEVPSEQEEQIRASVWMDKMGIAHHHSPNGGFRDAREGAKFKRMGTSAGYPDFVLPYARKGYHGLYIEVKRRYGGKLSEAQIYWRDLLIREGYAWYEAKGADQCIKIVQNYLGMTNE